MDEKKYTYRVIWVVTIVSALLLLSLIGAWIHEGFGKEWRVAQRDYGALLDEDEDFERGILQVELPQFSRVDRCISCHAGIEDPRMKEVPQPHTFHPGAFLNDHPVKGLRLYHLSWRTGKGAFKR